MDEGLDTITRLPVGTDARSRPLAKWGDAAVPGWQALPDVLLKNQAALGLSATDMLVLVNVLSHWWYVEEKPFPRPTSIARRMGITVRTVQRSIQTLVDTGLLERRKTIGQDGNKRVVLDPRGLVRRLQELARNDPNYFFKLQRTGSDGFSEGPSRLPA